jgi:hypothetical protein
VGTRIALRLLLSLILGPPIAAAAAELPKATLLLERGDPGGGALGGLLKSRLRGLVELNTVLIAEDSLADPIRKGRLLAALSGRRLVIPVGDEATGFALGELEETPVYFVGASVARGAVLASPIVGGLLRYSAGDVLAAMPGAWRDGLGVLYSPGYEPVIREIRAAARSAGVRLIEARVGSSSELPAAARGLFPKARAVWVLGEPFLAREAGFEFLAEEALSEDVPLIGPGVAEVRQGAVFCSEAENGPLAAQAADGILRLLADGRPGGPVLAREGGRIVYRSSLARRFGLVPRPPVWVEVR